MFVRREIDNVLFPPSTVADHICDNLYDGDNRVNVQILEERLVQSSCWVNDHLDKVETCMNTSGFSITQNPDRQKGNFKSMFGHNYILSKTLHYDQLECNIKDQRKKCSYGVCNGSKNSNTATFICYQCKFIWNFDENICENSNCRKLHENINLFKHCAFSFFNKD